MSKNLRHTRQQLSWLTLAACTVHSEAAKLAKETSSKNYDATVDVAIRLGVDPRKADQLVRGTVSLPHGTGKDVRVAVFAEGEKATEAEAAGADIVGTEALLEAINAGNLDLTLQLANPRPGAAVLAA